MTSYVLVYERASGTLRDTHAVEDPVEAFRLRLDLEKTVPSGVEVVVLTGDSYQDLASTHGRYFKSAAELLAPDSAA